MDSETAAYSWPVQQAMSKDISGRLDRYGSRSTKFHVHALARGVLGFLRDFRRTQRRYPVSSAISKTSIYRHVPLIIVTKQ